jgi:hypothetical protein
MKVEAIPFFSRKRSTIYQIIKRVEDEIGPDRQL